MQKRRLSSQRGLSLSGLIFFLVILAMLAVFGMKVTPSFLEYQAIKKAIVAAKESGKSVREIQAAFDRQKQIDDFEALSGKDLEIVREGEEFEVSFSYQKQIQVAGPVSLLIDYAGSTSPDGTSEQAE